MSASIAYEKENKTDSDVPRRPGARAHAFDLLCYFLLMLLVAGQQIPLALVWCAGSGLGSVNFLARLGATARWRGKNIVVVPIVDFYYLSNAI